MRTESLIGIKPYSEYDQSRIRDVVSVLEYDFQHRKVTHSTMDDARVSDRPTIWVADHQTHGRGRPGNRWEAEPGKSILVTFAETDKLRLKNPLLLPQLAALAASRAIEQVTGRTDIQIRWPYDLEADGKKLGGVLIEHKISETTGQPLTLVGIGINVHDQKFPQFPWSAVALEQMEGMGRVDRSTLLIELAKEWSLMKGIAQILDTDPVALDFWNGEWRKYQSIDNDEVEVTGLGPDQFDSVRGRARKPSLGKGLEVISTKAIDLGKKHTVFEWNPLSAVRKVKPLASNST
jgi:biotin-[acetyl-CoA-carboxylase] ligase BirA-like protein